ncbi:MAG TPA: DUF2461 domain-containing protein [Candidatus Gracilibacteria bacterium]
MNKLPDIIDFLSRLSKNNNKPWFEDHKGEFKELQDYFKELAQGLGQSIAGFDPEIARILGEKKTIKVFRIYRDARFSKDKTPYKTNFGACIAEGGEPCCSPCYYLHIEPGDQSFIAGGMHMPTPEKLNNIRDHIAEKATDLRKVLKSPEIQKAFGGLSEYAMLKTAPKGFPKEHPDIDLLRFKSFILQHKIKDKDLKSNKFFDQILEEFRVMKPFNDYLRKAIK